MTQPLPHAARKEFERAVALFNEGRLATAEGICAELIARFPLDADIAHFGGVLANRMGRHDLAVQRLSRLAASRPPRARALAALGLAHDRLGHLEEARSAFAAAVAAEPALGEARNGLGMVARRMGDAHLALEQFEAAVRLDPRSVEPRINAARVLLDQGRRPEAAAHYREALAQAQGRLAVIRACTVGLLEARDPGAAIAACRALLQHDPADGLSRAQLALALHAKALDVEADAEIATAVETAPDDPTVRNIRGVFRLEKGDWDAAARDFEHALAAQPGFAEALVNLAICLARAGRRDEALERMREARSGADPSGLARLALLYSEMGESAESMATARQALRSGGALPDAHIALYTELMRAGDMARGWDEYLYRPTRGFDIYEAIAHGRYPPPLPSPLAGAPIVIVAEQGLGDMLVFLRYAKPLADAGARLLLRNLDPRLVPLVKRAMPFEVDTGEGGTPSTLVWAGDLSLFVRPLDANPAPPSLAIAPLPGRVERMRETIASADARPLVAPRVAGGHDLAGRTHGPSPAHERSRAACVGRGAARIKIAVCLRPARSLPRRTWPSCRTRSARKCWTWPT